MDVAAGDRGGLVDESVEVLRMAAKVEQLDKALIEQAFEIMGRELADRRRFAEICLFGGSALIFLYDWRKVSGDVDVVIRKGEDHAEIIRARNVAAKRLDLHESWLNEGVTQYVSSLADAAFDGQGFYPADGRGGLRVKRAKPGYILALKVMAMGERTTPDDRDFRDAAGVAGELGLSTVDEILEAVRQYFPNQPIPLLSEGRLDELAKAATARRRRDKP